ncbi:hypothetical protein [Streptomyces sp. NPDC051567]|uniref:effector-associated constant component EACC1 n=1 Tax=Streptomyces sp. NPDC051567 TaxID=3365660 RepID=UPI0037922BD3
MSTTHAGPADHRVSILDADPEHARREAQDLLAAITEADPVAALRLPAERPDPGRAGGGTVTDLVGVVFSGGSLIVAGVQVWLARVPQRTVIVTRPDGASMRISGKEARDDDERIARFLAEAPLPTENDENPGPAPSPR